MTKPTALEKQRSLSSTSSRDFSHTVVDSLESLQISKDYVARAQQFANARVHETLQKYHSNREAALLTSGVYPGVDRTQWKLSKGGKRHHAISCYKKVSSRTQFRGLKISHRSKQDQSAVDSMRMTMTANESASSVTLSEQTELLAIGHVPGTLEDVLHGTVNLTPEAMQIESSHAQRDLLDSRVLSVLVFPSVTSPFRSLTLKWALRHHEVLSRHRDYVYLEATGVLQDAHDESAKVGYHLVHSVSLPSAPELAPDMQIVRGHLSYCYLYRQHSPSEVELFFYGGMLPRGGAKDRLAFQIMANTVQMSPSSIDCAMMKKLAYSLRTKDLAALRESSQSLYCKDDDNRMTQRTHSSILGSSMFRASSVMMDSNRSSVISGRIIEASSCHICERPVRVIFGGKLAICELCEEPVCHRCKVNKKIFVFKSGVFHPQKMIFCVKCMVAMNHLNAGWVASQELTSAAFQLRLSKQTRSSENEYGSSFRIGLGSSRLDNTDKDRDTMSSDVLMRQSTSHSVVWLPSDHLLSNSTSIEPVHVHMEEEYIQLQDDSSIDTEAFVWLDGDDDCFDEVIPMIEIPSEGEDDEYGSDNKLLKHAVDFVYVSESS
ncbi:Zinc finger, RING/FYVE/PHD-type [Plasmopara halstedii]|uniref:Zinc finger, RING/FYVE/PHD-type n=1 Tax=Plasmopara halstedii TaxID=4781 RepID=A0A0P1ASG8_PLAHL|nr:Zinc finger, RING/FYVE/PHD-type [Plasmopara halstedii]CEG44929.1 Zinc finger, RING/FYVE/PHD-type [Plasmopara halstedii]|eukprot:XP_024581298.1 Zinc finger, RING/FYVE/PHD-type [Plasmopara halstedii]